MHIIKFFFCMVLGLAAIIVALKIIGIFFFVVAIAIKLLWLAILLGLVAFVGWIIYRLVSPSRVQQF
jgi:hypothetical protein